MVTPSVGQSTGQGTVQDPNGNQISISAAGVITDTLGMTALTVSGTPPSNTTYTYAAPSGANASVTRFLRFIPRADLLSGGWHLRIPFHTEISCQ